MAKYIKQALVIGNDTYINNSLNTCVNDAVDVKNCLHPMGFEVKCGKNLNFKAMNTSINQFIESIEQGSIAMFYYSGHGMQYNGINYLIPTDAHNVVMNQLEMSIINLQKLIHTMYEKRPRLILVILDCCRAFVRRQTSDARAQISPSMFNMINGLAPMQPPPATIIAYACAADEVSIGQSKNDRNSLYTYHLLQRISTPNMDVDLVLRKVASDVLKDPWNLAQQIPFRYSSCNEIIYLAGNQPTNPSIPSGGYFQPRPIINQPHKNQHRKTNALNIIHYPHNHIVRPQINHYMNNMGSPRNGINMAVRPVYPFPHQFYPYHRR